MRIGSTRSTAKYMGFHGCGLCLAFVSLVGGMFFSLSVQARELHVAQDGSEEYSSVSEAVEAAQEGDTILVAPGVYVESLDLSHKEVNLIGADRDTCIVQNHTEDYDFPPLNICAGRVANLTFCAAKDPVASTLTPNTALRVHITPDGITGFTNYAVHVESDASYGRELVFENCFFVSECNNPVGMGMRGNFTVTFRDCVIYSAGDRIPLIMHDAAKGFYGPSHLILDHVSIWSATENYAMEFWEYYPELNCSTVLELHQVTAPIGTNKKINLVNMQGKSGNGYLGSVSFSLAKNSDRKIK